jgi:hypothetical protein
VWVCGEMIGVESRGNTVIRANAEHVHPVRTYIKGRVNFQFTAFCVVSFVFYDRQ